MSSAAQFGSAIHKALEVLFDQYSDAQYEVQLEQSYLAFQRHLQRNKEVFSKDEFEDFFGYGKEVLENYLAQYSITSNTTRRENEVAVKANIEGIEIRGNIDRIDKLDSTWHVFDYKTGKFNNTYRPFNRPQESVVQNTSHHVEQYGGDYWRQAVFYYILLQHAHHPINIQGTVGSVQFQYVEQKDDKAQEPHFVNISQEDVTAVTHQIKEVHGKIQRFELEGCGREDCEWCSLHQSTSA
jgi:DNA helicase-2/ATP-dependent DNA helicase PcrA